MLLSSHRKRRPHFVFEQQSVELPIQEEAMDVARCAPQGAHYQSNVGPTQARFTINIVYTPSDNTLLHSIPCVRRPWGYKLLVLSRHSAKSLNAQEERLATSPNR